MRRYDFNSVRGNIFLEYLNSVYSSKQYLLKFLPEIGEFVTHKNLRYAVEEFAQDNLLQVESLNELYSSIQEDYVAKKILSLRVMALEGYKAAIEGTVNPLERDCAILFCLQGIDSVEVVYFKNLCLMADTFDIGAKHFRVPLDCALDNLLLFNDVYQEIIT